MGAVDKLNREVQKELAAEAVKAARDLGYCDETVRVLEQMGFSLDNNVYEVTLKVRAEVPFGFDIENASWYVTTEDEAGEPVEFYSGDINVVSVN